MRYGFYRVIIIRTMTEKIPGPEFSAFEEELIAGLRANPESARETLSAWQDQEDAKLKEANAPSRATIETNLRLARIYRAAGMPDAAYDTLEAVSNQAQLEQEEDLHREAVRIMEEMNRENR